MQNLKPHLACKLRSFRFASSYSAAPILTICRIFEVTACSIWGPFPCYWCGSDNMSLCSQTWPHWQLAMYFSKGIILSHLINSWNGEYIATVAGGILPCINASTEHYKTKLFSPWDRWFLSSTAVLTDDDVYFFEEVPISTSITIFNRLPLSRLTQCTILIAQAHVMNKKSFNLCTLKCQI